MIDQEGKLKNSAIPKEELKRQVNGEPPHRGCSVFREAHVDEGKLREEATSLIGGKIARTEAWKFRWSTDALRALMEDDNHRSVCVVDRAEIDNASHAELWGARAGRSNGALKNLRDRVLSLLEPIGRIDLAGDF